MKKNLTIMLKLTIILNPKPYIRDPPSVAKA